MIYVKSICCLLLLDNHNLHTDTVKALLSPMWGGGLFFIFDIIREGDLFTKSNDKEIYDS